MECGGLKRTGEFRLLNGLVCVEREGMDGVEEEVEMDRERDRKWNGVV